MSKCVCEPVHTHAPQAIHHFDSSIQDCLPLTFVHTYTHRQEGEQERITCYSFNCIGHTAHSVRHTLCADRAVTTHPHVVRDLGVLSDNAACICLRPGANGIQVGEAAAKGQEGLEAFSALPADISGR